MTVPRANGLELSADERAMLEGREGEAVQFAMEVIVRIAGLTGARRLVPITRAHIDSCLYHGLASLDFAELLASRAARVRVPTTLNVGALDLLHPELFRGDPETARRARRLMELYTEMGCQPTWTCAPYQLPDRPSFGEQIAWAESNAIVFANSVLGARTDRYGDFVDILAALAGRAPLAGLHVAANRRARIVFRLEAVARGLLEEDAAYPLIGHLVGQRAGTAVPVLTGLPARVPEHRLKAIGAAAASSGAVAMFHAVGSTPEAATLEAALGGNAPEREIVVDSAMLHAARDDLSARTNGSISAVSVGTPHFSIAEFDTLDALIADDDGFAVDFYVSTNRATLSELERRGRAERLRAAGIQLVVDTCTYVTPILRRTDGLVMTNSAKWAFYAPANLGVAATFGSLRECVESARRGQVWRDESLWQTEAGSPGDPGRPATDPRMRGPGEPSRVPEPAGAGWILANAVPIVGELDFVGHSVLVLDEPISLWGGVDPATGRIVEARHPQAGRGVAGCVLVMPGGRGSSSSSSVLAEMVRAGTAPAAIVLLRPDPIIALGAIVAQELYGRSVAVFVVGDGGRPQPSATTRSG